MKALIVLISILLFGMVLFGVLYASVSYITYRDLIPKLPAVGPISRIRASMIMLHDPHDLNVTDECKKYFRRYVLGNCVAIFALVLTVVFVLIARSLDLQRFLD